MRVQQVGHTHRLDDSEQRRQRQTAPQPAPPPVGDAAPAFEGTSHTGDTIRLSDFRGQRLILWFFPKADTPG